MTEGDLALKMARAAGIALPATAANAEEAATAALRKAGIALGSDPRAPLTQGSLARIGRSAGANISTSKPGSLVTPGLSEAFVRSITPALQVAAAASGASGTSQIHASCQGRESRAGRKGTPASNANPNATAPPCDPTP